MTKHLHLDCFSGISGDMMLAGLIDLGVPLDLLTDQLASLNLPGTLSQRRVKKAGIDASYISVEYPQEHKHRHLSHIIKLIDGSSMTIGAKDLARRMFHKLAEAEAAVHGTTIEKVHFHEVGAVDSIFDFCGIAIGIDFLKPDHITARPVPTGFGFVQCEHGRMPIPAPATARLLMGVPLSQSDIEFELTTPTGAACVATLAQSFTMSPTMTIEKIGYGAGTKDFPKHANVLRLFWGHSDAVVPSSARDVADQQTVDQVVELSCQVDDISPEVLGYAMDCLFEHHALDVFYVPVHMKKNRVGTLLTVLAKPDDVSTLESILFEQTGTFGVRRHASQRSKLARTHQAIETSLGTIRMKVGKIGDHEIATPEFDDCVTLARQHQRPLREVMDEAKATWHRQSREKNSET